MKRCVLIVLLALGLSGSGHADTEGSGRLAFASARAHGADLDLYVAGWDGSASARVTSTRADEFSPTWSTDGSRLAYRLNPPRSDRGDIWVMDADGSGKRNLTKTAGTAEWSPAWSPDGSVIAYFSAARGGDVWVMRPDGSGKRNLTAGASPLSEYPTWSPDGRQLAFNDHREGNFEIFAMEADGSGQVNLTRNAASDEWPSWSPDGSSIAFRTDREGDEEIYVMQPDGSGPTNVSRSPGTSDDFPVWRPDGRLSWIRDGDLWLAAADGTEQRLVARDAQFAAWTPTPAPAPRAAGEVASSEGVVGVLEAFERAPLVAFAEEHHNARQHEFLRSLIRHPAFPEAVRDVVVEFGNARYQGLVDRYVGGEAVSLARVRDAWLKTTLGDAWNGRTYEQFFVTARTVNRSLPKAKRIRIVLGDPPIDWSKIRSQADLERWIGQRNTHYAGVVERHVLAKGRKALLVAGAFHLLRRPGRLNETGLLERKRPGSVYVVLPHLGFVGPSERVQELERRLATWPVPSLAPLAGSWLGSLSGAALFDERWASGTIADMADAYLYLGATSGPPRGHRLPPSGFTVARGSACMGNAGVPKL